MKVVIERRTKFRVEGRVTPIGIEFVAYPNEGTVLHPRDLGFSDPEVLKAVVDFFRSSEEWMRLPKTRRRHLRR